MTCKYSKLDWVVITAAGRRWSLQATDLIEDLPKHYPTPKYPKMMKKYENLNGSFTPWVVLYSQASSQFYLGLSGTTFHLN
jgi:hypothetical protein